MLKQGVNILSGCGMQSDTKQKHGEALPVGESVTLEAHPISFTMGGQFTSFKKELQQLSQQQQKDKLENVKKLLTEAAGAGRTKLKLWSDCYDDNVIAFLRSEGIEANEYRDFRDGNFLMITW